MKLIIKYWRVLLALILLIAAGFSVKGYMDEKLAYEKKTLELKTYTMALQNTIAENEMYVDIQPALEGAVEEVEASRLELYQHFPVEMKEEDQIMYVLYLEKLFGTEIQFNFNSPAALVPLSDGSNLMGLTLTVNYETTYQGFQDMINYLATDSRITSVQSASIVHDASKDRVVGNITLLLYLVDSDLLEYTPPDVNTPETGKDNIYD